MRKALEKGLLYLLRKVSKQEWEKSEDVKKKISGLEEKTLITIDGDAPGVVMKLYYPDNKAFHLLEQLINDEKQTNG